MDLNTGLIRVQQQNSNLVDIQTQKLQAKEEQVAKAEGESGKVSNTDGDKVSISPEAFKKQASEADESGSKGATSTIIEQLKQKIEKVKEQLKALEGDESPGAEDQRKMLTEQLGMLSAALQSAIEEEVKVAQASLKELGA